MPRIRLAFPLLLFAVSSFAQNEPAANINESSTVITTASQLRRIEPPSPTASVAELEQKADILRVEKYYADAIDYYEAALQKASDRAVLYDKKGIAHLLMLHLGEAKRDFERSMRANSKYPEAMNNLAVIYYYERNYGKAAKFYRRAIAIAPQNASFHSNLGTAYFEKKDYTRASQEYATALSLDPEIFERRSQSGVSAHMASPEDRARYSYVLAKMFATRGDAERCLLYLKKAMEEGFKVAESFQKDHEFAGFRKDPRFMSLLQHGPLPLPE
jgi:tetratricopeptide (TPR) repeat protein